MPVLGVPSAAEELQEAFGNQRAHVGADGESRTAYVLDKAYKTDPDTWALHDVSAPGYTHANIDHVVLRSRTDGTLRIVVIDSKLWQPGKYRTSKNGITRDGALFEPANKALGLADMADALSRYLGVSADSFSLLLAVWPSSRGNINLGMIAKQLDVGRGVRMVRGADLVTSIENALGVGATPSPECMTSVERLVPLLRGGV